MVEKEEKEDSRDTEEQLEKNTGDEENKVRGFFPKLNFELFFYRIPSLFKRM